jgi:hypothetical protein
MWHHCLSRIKIYKEQKSRLIILALHIYIYVTLLYQVETEQQEPGNNKAENIL